MADKAKNETERLARIVDGLGDLILNATDEEILQIVQRRHN